MLGFDFGYLIYSTKADADSAAADLNGRYGLDPYGQIYTLVLPHPNGQRFAVAFNDTMASQLTTEQEAVAVNATAMSADWWRRPPRE